LLLVSATLIEALDIRPILTPLITLNIVDTIYLCKLTFIVGLPVTRGTARICDMLVAFVGR